MSKQGDASVYVLESSGYVKIGLAQNARRRLYNIRSSNPFSVELAFATRHKRSEAREIEILAHKLLHDRRKMGEWFSASVGDAIDAVLSARERLGYAMVRMEARPRGIPGRARTPIDAEFANLVFQRMKAIRLRVTDMAGIIGCSRQLIWVIIHGRQNASPTVRKLIESILFAEEIRLRDYLCSIHGIPNGE